MAAPPMAAALTDEAWSAGRRRSGTARTGAPGPTAVPVSAGPVSAPLKGHPPAVSAAADMAEVLDQPWSPPTRGPASGHAGTSGTAPPQTAGYHPRPAAETCSAAAYQHMVGLMLIPGRRRTASNLGGLGAGITPPYHGSPAR